jgi:protein-S-isoprenylcysteine O-methyltransferase Ste14
MDAGSKYLIAFTNGLAVLAAVIIALNVPSASLQHQYALFWIGASIFAGGGLLRKHCFRMLGNSFTAVVKVCPDQVVVDKGIYRYVRHPSYTGAIIQFLGFGLALANWESILTLLVPAIGVFWYRSVVEEQAMVKVIGRPYVNYMRRTKRFIPFII